MNKSLPKFFSKPQLAFPPQTVDIVLSGKGVFEHLHSIKCVNLYIYIYTSCQLLGSCVCSFHPLTKCVFGAKYSMLLMPETGGLLPAPKHHQAKPLPELLDHFFFRILYTIKWYLYEHSVLLISLYIYIFVQIFRDISGIKLQ